MEITHSSAAQKQLAEGVGMIEPGTYLGRSLLHASILSTTVGLLYLLVCGCGSMLGALLRS